jgi:hypothetical protein
LSQEARRKSGRPQKAVAALRGTWRLVETEMWDVDDLDLVESAHLTLGPQGLGELQLIAIGAGIDYRISERDGMPFVEFSWAGYDDSEPASGRGWARLEPSGALKGRLFIHQGDESGFTAYREAEGQSSKGGPRGL